MKAMPSSSERLAPQSISFSGPSYSDVPTGLPVTLRSRSSAVRIERKGGFELSWRTR